MRVQHARCVIKSLNLISLPFSSFASLLPFVFSHPVVLCSMLLPALMYTYFMHTIIMQCCLPMDFWWIDYMSKSMRPHGEPVCEAILLYRCFCFLYYDVHCMKLNKFVVELIKPISARITVKLHLLDYFLWTLHFFKRGERWHSSVSPPTTSFIVVGAAAAVAIVIVTVIFTARFLCFACW